MRPTARAKPRMPLAALPRAGAAVRAGGTEARAWAGVGWGAGCGALIGIDWARYLLAPQLLHLARPGARRRQQIIIANCKNHHGKNDCRDLLLQSIIEHASTDNRCSEGAALTHCGHAAPLSGTGAGGLLQAHQLTTFETTGSVWSIRMSTSPRCHQNRSTHYKRSKHDSPSKRYKRSKY